MKKILRFLSMINFRSVYFNFKYFPLKDAIKLPVLISSNMRLSALAGKVVINAKIQTGIVRIGYGNMALFDRRSSKGIWEVKGQVTFEGRAWIGQGSKISVGDNGSVTFGDNFEVTANSAIVCYDRIVFGQNCLISWDVLIMDTDFHDIMDADDTVINKPRRIRIGDHVWIGCRCTILKGVFINSETVIAAGTTVTRNLEMENVVYGGNPVVALKQNINWKQ